MARSRWASYQTSQTASSGRDGSGRSPKRSWEGRPRPPGGCADETAPWVARRRSRCSRPIWGPVKWRLLCTGWSMGCSADPSLAADKAPDGRTRRGGPRRYGGRWNHPGVAAVYTAAHLSLAVLEAFVHVPAVEDLPTDLVAIAADLPDDLRIEHVKVGDLPRDWRRTPAPAALADRGTAWVMAARTAVLAVPSAVVPPENK